MQAKHFVRIIVGIMVVASLVGGLAYTMARPSVAQAGSVVDDFNPGAVVTDGTIVPVKDILVQPNDHKVLVAGYFDQLAGQPRGGIGRLNTDGSLDESFNPADYGVVYVMKLQPDDGKIVIGLFDNLVRLNTDGSQDAGFNPPKACSLTVPVSVQADGKIVASYSCITNADGSHTLNSLVRLNPDGSLDPTFDPATYVYPSIVTQDSKSVRLGSYVELVNPDGSVFSHVDADSTVTTAAVQPDGKIVVGGSFTRLGGLPRNRVAQLNADGSVDPEFDPNVTSGDRVEVVRIQPDGQILIGGWFDSVCGQPRESIARLNSDGVCADNPTVPAVGDEKSFEVATDSCVSGTDATFTITTQDGKTYPPDSSWPNVLTESSDGSGHYVATVPPLWQFSMSGMATVKFSISCSGSQEEKTTTIFIDPSGRITDTQGNPVADAGVTLLYSTSGSQTGPFEAVPDQNAGLPAPIMSGANQSNPIVTDNLGFYRWDVVPGWYKVRVEKAGCGSPVESSALQVEEGGLPATDINLTLDCIGSRLSVQITPQSDWQTGYCRNVIVTNSSAQPVDWKISFVTEGAINNFWNAGWSQTGKQVTAEGVNWNNILQPGESTHDVGFCANRTPGAGPTPPLSGVTVSLATQSDWGTGYCATVTVKNNGSAAADWKVTFDVVGIINNLWNAVWSQSGNQVTAEGVDWNNILQPGESTHSIGFCTNR